MFLGTLIAFLAGLTELGSRSYRFNEVFSVRTSQNLANLFQIAWNNEGNSWLYYLLLHFWLYLGSSETVVRLLSVLFATATIPIIYLIGKRFDSFTAKVSSLIVSLNLLFVLYAQLARGYSLLFLLTSLSSLFLLNALEKKSKLYWVLFVLVTTLGVYTHLYALLVLSAQLFSLLFYKKAPWLSAILASVAIFVLSLPLFLSPAIHSGQIDWIAKPTIASLLGTFIVLSSDFLPLTFLFIIFLFISIRKIRSWYVTYFASLLFVPILLAFTFSVFVKPLYQSVYFIICVMPLAVLVGYGISLIKSSYQKIAIAFIIVLSLVRLFWWYSQSGYSIIIDNKTEDWRSASSYIARNIASGDQIIFYAYFGREPYAFYAKPQNIIEIASNTYANGGGKALPNPNVKLLQQLSYPHLWYVTSYSTENDPKSDFQSDLIQNTLEKNYKIVLVKHFTQIDVTYLSHR